MFGLTGKRCLRIVLLIISKRGCWRKILNVRRIGKNILIDLSGNKTILVHQKMTGHFLYGNWKMPARLASESVAGGAKWISEESGPIKDDPQNRFIHLIFDLSNGKQLALSDLRKFAKVLLWPTDKLSELEDINNLGPDPTAEDFDFNKFQERLVETKRQNKNCPDGSVCLCRHRQYLFRRNLMAVRNSPDETGFVFDPKELKSIFTSTKKILKQALEARGTSDSDYRDPSGKKASIKKCFSFTA